MAGDHRYAPRGFELRAAEVKDGGSVWLRYTVDKDND
jgi:hypothetical protein